MLYEITFPDDEELPQEIRGVIRQFYVTDDRDLPDQIQRAYRLYWPEIEVDYSASASPNTAGTWYLGEWSFLVRQVDLDTEGLKGLYS